jgi:acyl-CoA thioester hydrolase
MTFKEAARFGDVLEIRTTPKIVSNFRIAFDQQVWRVGGNKALVLGNVEMVCVDKQNKMVALPSLVMKEMKDRYGVAIPSSSSSLTMSGTGGIQTT